MKRLPPDQRYPRFQPRRDQRYPRCRRPQQKASLSARFFIDFLERPLGRVVFAIKEEAL